MTSARIWRTAQIAPRREDRESNNNTRWRLVEIAAPSVVEDEATAAADDNIGADTDMGSMFPPPPPLDLDQIQIMCCSNYTPLLINVLGYSTLLYSSCSLSLSLGWCIYIYNTYDLATPTLSLLSVHMRFHARTC